MLSSTVVSPPFISLFLRQRQQACLSVSASEREMKEAQWLEPITPPWLFIKTASAVPRSICHNVFTIYPPFLSSLPAHHWHLGDLSRLLLKQSFATGCNLLGKQLQFLAQHWNLLNISRNSCWLRVKTYVNGSSERKEIFRYIYIVSWLNHKFNWVMRFHAERNPNIWVEKERNAECRY